LVKGYLAVGTVALLVGASEAGKSTIAVDLANKVAQHYDAVIVAAEDGATIRAQIRAWELLHGRTRAPRLSVIDGPVLLDDSSQVDDLIDQLRPLAPRLVIFDTLSASLPGGRQSEHDRASARCRGAGDTPPA